MTIRDSLVSVQRATYCILLPEPPSMGGNSAPTGTGFFVSPEGWFVTARHVLTTGDDRYAGLRDDLCMIGLANPLDGTAELRCSLGARLVYQNAQSDFALLKAEPMEEKELAYLEVSKREVSVGEPVYIFGYPLSDLCNLGGPRPVILSTYSIHQWGRVATHPEAQNGGVCRRSKAVLVSG